MTSSKWLLFFLVVTTLVFSFVSSSAQSGAVCTVGYSEVACQSAAVRTIVVAQDGSGNLKNISQAVAQAQPGDTILVKDGHYNEFFTVDRSGTARLPITIKNFPGAHPLIFAGAQRGNEITVRGDWIIFDGFEFEKSWGGITVYGSHVIIRNNYIHDNGELSDPNGVLNGMGMLLVSDHDVLIDNNRFERNGVHHHDNSHMHGVYLSDYYYRGMYNITFTNNYFEGHGGSGIQVWINRKANGGNHHLLIEKNTFKNNAVELIFTFVEDTLVRNNTFVHDSHPPSSFKPEGFSAILWFELSHDNQIETNTFESKLNGPNDYVILEKNRGDTQIYRNNTWNVPTHAVFKHDGTDYSDFATMFPKLANSPDRIQLTTASAVAAVPLAESAPVNGATDLQKYVGLFGSRKPPAQVRIFLDGNSLKATMLNEPGRPTYFLRPLSPNRFHIEGAPSGFDMLFQEEGSRVRGLITYRPGFTDVTLTREQ